MRNLESFSFVEALPVQPDVLVDAQVNTKPALLSKLAKGLQFPPYFGQNWDGLVDCLTDLSWAKKPAVEIAHAALPALPPRQLTVYLECLHDALAGVDARPVKLSVVFREADRAAVAAALAPPAKPS